MPAAALKQTGYYSSGHFVPYRGYTIKRVDHAHGFLADGHMIHEGFIACDVRGSTNMMPGAAWFRTVEDTKGAIDDLIASNIAQGRPADSGDARTEDFPVFDAQDFWARRSVRREVEASALDLARTMARLMIEAQKTLTPEQLSQSPYAEAVAILRRIDNSTDTRATIQTPDGSVSRIGAWMTPTGLSYL